MESPRATILLIEPPGVSVVPADGLASLVAVCAASVEEGVVVTAEQEFEAVVLNVGALWQPPQLVSLLRTVPWLPVIVVTEEEAAGREAVQLGAGDYLMHGQCGDGGLARTLRYAVERNSLQQQIQKANAVSVASNEELQQANAQLQEEVAESRRAEQQTLKSNRQLTAALGQLNSAITDRNDSARPFSKPLQALAQRFSLEFKTIVSLCESARKTAAEMPVFEAYLEKISRSAYQSMMAARDLCDPRQGSSNGSFSIRALLEEQIAACRVGLQGRECGTIDIFADEGPDVAFAGDRAELKVALEHILESAIESIPRRGSISVSTATESGWLLITLADDGIGISEERLQQCLQTSPAGAGIPGDGLADAVRRIRALGGKVDLRSQQGRGTTAVVGIPMTSASPPPAQPQPATKSLRILVVEDEPMVREVLGVYLAEDGHQISFACNGREGLEAFRAKEFDLVMTDRAMPELDGQELALEIKKQSPEQPVILLTGFGELPGEKLQAIDLVVSKPFTLSTLRAGIARVCAL